MYEKIRQSYVSKLKAAREAFLNQTKVATLLEEVELPGGPLETYVDSGVMLTFWAEDLKGSVRKSILTPLLDAGFELESGPDTTLNMTRYSFSQDGVKVKIDVIGEGPGCKLVGTGEFEEKKILVCDE